MKRMSVVLIAMFMLVGCATVDNFRAELNRDPVLKKAAIQTTVRLFLGNKPIEWARSVYVVTEGAIEKVNSNLITDIDGLEEHVKKEIGFDRLYESDQLIVQALINQIRADIEVTLKMGQISDSMLYVKSVLTWINGTAKDFI